MIVLLPHFSCIQHKCQLDGKPDEWRCDRIIDTICIICHNVDMDASLNSCISSCVSAALFCASAASPTNHCYMFRTNSTQFSCHTWSESAIAYSLFSSDRGRQRHVSYARHNSTKNRHRCRNSLPISLSLFTESRLRWWTSCLRMCLNQRLTKALKHSIGYTNALTFT